jgi:hypothetical protein
MTAGRISPIVNGQTEQVTRIAHLAQEERYDGQTLARIIVGQDLGFADSVTPDEQDVLRARGDVEDFEKFSDVDTCRHGCPGPMVYRMVWHVQPEK